MNHPASPSPSRRRVVLLFFCAAVLGGAFWLWPRTPFSRNGITAAGTARLAEIDTPPTAVSSATPTRHEAARTETGPRAGVDASDFYKNAFVLYDALSDEEKKMFDKPFEAADPEKVAALFAKIQPIMELLREAVTADYCDWGLGPLRVNSNLPHIFKGMALGKLALWEANQRFTSDPAGAMDDLSARGEFAHHLTESVIGGMVQVSFAASATELLRRRAGEMDGTTSAKVLDFLWASQPEADVARCFQGEMAMLASLEATMLAQPPETRLESLKGMSASENTLLEKIKTDDLSIRADFAHIAKVEKQLAEAVTWPDERFNPWWQTVIQEAESRPLASAALPIYDGVRARYQRIRVQNEMVAAAIGMVQNGEANLATLRDSVTGQPFIYVETPTGFELRSNFKVKGKPLTMEFPLQKKL